MLKRLQFLLTRGMCWFPVRHWLTHLLTRLKVSLMQASYDTTPPTHIKGRFWNMLDLSFCRIFCWEGSPTKWPKGILNILSFWGGSKFPYQTPHKLTCNLKMETLRKEIPTKHPPFFTGSKCFFYLGVVPKKNILHPWILYFTVVFLGLLTLW